MSSERRKSQDYEQQHVHDVYEQIASHFSSTRYKPWPIIERFLKDLPDGSVGLDVGCGNGKYLAVNRNIFIVASDRSSNLVSIARSQAHHLHAVVVADLLQLPHPKAAFDFAISIAVVHHLSTPERRVEAVRSILETLTPGGGRALIYVWALEQENSRRGWSEGDDQDVMVPWVTRGSKRSAGGKVKSAAEDMGEAQTMDSEVGRRDEAGGDKVVHRYYHLYRKGELEEDVRRAGGVVVDSGYEKDNWWAIATRAPTY